jgi:SAM-dependent methyltransferase
MSLHDLPVEFSDPRLVAIYDTVNPIAEYKTFYLELAEKLSAASIVDIGCGSGLLTCELAKQRYEMIGVEPSHGLLELARRRPGCEKVKWIEGYVQQLDDTKADLAIMTGHVAQFFLDDACWRAALTTIHGALNPGGHIAFESRNPLVRPFDTWPTLTSHRKLDDPVAGKIEWWAKLLVIEGNRLRYEIHYLFVNSGEELVSTNELIFRSQTEIGQSLSDAGFSVRNVYGDWDSSPLCATSPDMIFVAARNT